MWARVVEVMLAVWLALSPFIFRGDAEGPSQWLLYGSATLITALAVLSYWRPMAKAHLGIFVVAVGMFLWGRFANAPPGPGHQNLIGVAFLLMMFSIIPNDCLRPPRVWREAETAVGGSPR